MTARAAWTLGLVIVTGALAPGGLAGCAAGGERAETASAAVAAARPIEERLHGLWEIDPAGSAEIARSVEGGVFTAQDDADVERLRQTLLDRKSELPSYYFEPDGTGSVAASSRTGATRLFTWSATGNRVRIAMNRNVDPDAPVLLATLEDGERLVVALPEVGTFLYRRQ